MVGYGLDLEGGGGVGLVEVGLDTEEQVGQRHLPRFAYGLAMVWLWFGYGLAMVWLWFGHGTGHSLAKVWLWFDKGLALVWLWFGFGLAVVSAVVWHGLAAAPRGAPV